MKGSLVPANTKKSTLILGMFRLVPDVVIAASGTVTTIILLFILSNFNIPVWILILCLVPMFLCVILVFPIPNYHNTLCAIQSILGFYQGRRKYIWRGWCLRHEYEKHK